MGSSLQRISIYVVETTTAKVGSRAGNTVVESSRKLGTPTNDRSFIKRSCIPTNIILELRTQLSPGTPKRALAQYTERDVLRWVAYQLNHTLHRLRRGLYACSGGAFYAPHPTSPLIQALQICVSSSHSPYNSSHSGFPLRSVPSGHTSSDFDVSRLACENRSLRPSPLRLLYVLLDR